MTAAGQLNQAVLDALPAHIAVIGPDGRIIATNRAWDQFLRDNAPIVPAGAPAHGGRGIGHNYLDVCRAARGADADGAADVLAGIQAVLDGRRPEFTFEYPCHSPRERRWFLLTVTPLDIKPEVIAGAGSGRQGAVVAHLDITGRMLAEESVARRAEELAAVAERLRRSNEELDKFAYITSHDLRAPLRGIANLSRWIEEDMGDRFTPEAHQQMELLRGRVNRMESMIAAILEYSRVGRVTDKPEWVDVAVLLAEVVELLDPPPKFTIDVQPGMPRVFGDRLRLQQVFQNLIGNAIKHHDPARAAGRVSVTWADPGAALYEFAVADDGPGIESQYFGKIFTIFQTLQPRDKVEGTGVGLSLVKKTVEHQGGAVRVESVPGRGAIFRFTWPKQVPAAGS
jgi:signal transduction histidine kinase